MPKPRHSGKDKADTGHVGSSRLTPDTKKSTPKADDDRTDASGHGAHRTPSEGIPLTVKQLQEKQEAESQKKESEED